MATDFFLSNPFWLLKKTTQVLSIHLSMQSFNIHYVYIIYAQSWKPKQFKNTFLLLPRQEDNDVFLYAFLLFLQDLWFHLSRKMHHNEKSNNCWRVSTGGCICLKRNLKPASMVFCCCFFFFNRSVFFCFHAFKYRRIDWQISRLIIFWCLCVNGFFFSCVGVAAWEKWHGPC